VVEVLGGRLRAVGCRVQGRLALPLPAVHVAVHHLHLTCCSRVAAALSPRNTRRQTIRRLQVANPRDQEEQEKE
jgi:hypothetical protein